MSMKMKLIIVGAAFTLGCTSPTAPTDCMGSELRSTYERLEGVRSGDPDYQEALKWSVICPEWNLPND
jgi:phosphodiesterase/alkaline phosphatase D-like protein